jgi:threonine 3-dehydrogenase
MFETWYKLASLLQSGLDLSPIITHQFSVDDFQRGFDTMGLASPAKCSWIGFKYVGLRCELPT